MRKLLLPILIVLCFNTAMAGGPWTRDKGTAYTGFNFSYLSYNSLYGIDGKDLPLHRTITELGIGAFVEYGVTDRLTIHLDLPFRIFSSSDSLETHSSDYFPDTLGAGRIIGLSYIGVGAKYRFLNKKVKMAAHLNYEANTSSIDAASGLRTAPATHVISPKISIGGEFGKFYAYAETGPRFRFSNFSEENDSTAQYSHDLDYTVEIGYSWNKKTYFAFVFSGRTNLTQGTYDNGLTTITETDSTGIITSYSYEADLQTGISPNRQEYFGLGLKFTQKLGDFAINAGVYGGPGKRVAKAPSFNLGFSYTFNPKKKTAAAE